MAAKQTIDKALDKGKGVLRLAPAWVPRSFCRPGKRIKLHPDDYYVLGLERGGIDERWLASTMPADNGPGTPSDEGLSYIVGDEAGEEKALLAEAVDLFTRDIIGQPLYDEYGKWPMFSKFFDNLGPLPHHIHHNEYHASLVGQAGKTGNVFFSGPNEQLRGGVSLYVFRVQSGSDQRRGQTGADRLHGRRQQTA